jgi:molybdate transport system ATP-binding protein
VDNVAFDIDIRKQLGNAQVELRVQTGPGITVLLGPSGAGKTSVLNMVAGLLRPDAGHVRVGGETLFDVARRIDLPPERRHCGYVFQDARLFPHLRVIENLRYGATRATGGTPGPSLEDITALLGIGELLARWPATLSGGEARRVAIGRALSSGARFLLLDEPLSFVDRARREEILRLIERLRDELGLPMLYVTHDVAEADRLGDTRVEL